LAGKATLKKASFWNLTTSTHKGFNSQVGLGLPWSLASMDYLRQLELLLKRQDPKTGNSGLDQLLGLLADPYRDQVGIRFVVKYLHKLIYLLSSSKDLSGLPLVSPLAFQLQ
jgi:hypothetical protein